MKRSVPRPIGGDTAYPSEKWVILGLLLCFQTLDGILRWGLGPLGPLVMSDLKIGPSALGALASAIRISGVAVAVVAGKVVDVIGIRRSIAAVAILTPAISSLFALAGTFREVFGAFLLLGVAIALVSPVGNAAIVESFEPTSRGLALGVKQMGVPLGAGLAGAALPPLAILLGWRLAFVAVGSLIGGASLVIAWIYPSTHHSQAHQYATEDGAGRAQARRSSKSPPTSDATNTWRILSSPGTPSLILVGFAFAATQACLLTFGAAFLTEGGRSMVAAGLFLGVSQIAGMFGRPISGAISDKLFNGRRKPVIVGLAFAASLAVLGLANWASEMTGVVLTVAMIIAGFFTLAWAGVFFAAALERGGRDSLGRASGLASTANMTGTLLGAPLFGLIADATAYSVAFSTFALFLAVVGIFFQLSFRER